ncbi:MAG: endolytic transglycosylase MltG [Mycobacteriales bacterium]
MTRAPQDLGFFPPEQYSRPSRSDRRRYESDRRRRRRRRLIVPLVLLLVLGLAGVGALYGGRSLLGRFGTTPDFQGQGTGEVLIRVQPGDTATDIAATLVAKGVVKSENAFRNAAKDDPRSVSIQPGTYRLHKQMSGASALALMLDPVARVLARVTVPEGLTVASTLKLISEKTAFPLTDLRAAAKDTKALDLPPYAKDRLEGFLFPETYDLEPGMTAAQLLKAMVDMYKDKIDASGLSARAGDVGLDPYKLVIVASLVERETQRVDERAKVARVIYNRLDRDFYLGVDAAILYGLGRSGGGLSAADLAKRTPYNNRMVKGLPPTPIANPGLASFQGAVAPAAGPWLYYVLDDDRSRRHVFTDDRDVFNAAKAKCQAAGLC